MKSDPGDEDADENGNGDRDGEISGDASLAVELELEDANGRRASVPLSAVAPITPPLKIQFLKLADLNQQSYTRLWEPTLQSYEIPLALFENVDLSRLAAVRFRLRGSGVVILDEIGFRRQVS